ncbi:MAG: D-alanyl-D-alanine carboxypeptidase/D-alanyl-D-alanine endopeptidase [Candidatus Acidiferrales bacterium]
MPEFRFRLKFFCAIFLLAAPVSFTAAAFSQAPVPGVRPPRQPAQPMPGTDLPPAQSRADRARFRIRVDQALADIRAVKSYWGLMVVDAQTGESIYELNADRYFVPASNTKIFTTALALATFGAEYRFRSTIETLGTLNETGTLSGDLVFVGRGDPDLSNHKLPFQDRLQREGPANRVLAELADGVAAKGVKEIDGDIVGDDSYFPYDPYPAGWTVGDLFFGFGAPVSAISYNDNSLSLEVQPAERPGIPALVSMEPCDGSDSVAYDISTGELNSKMKFEVVRQFGSPSTLLHGSIPLSAPPTKLDLAMSDPAACVARELKKLLEARGIRVKGQARVHHAPPQEPGVLSAPPSEVQPAPQALVLAEHFSMPLIEVVRLLAKVSQNLHAEILLRAVAREKTGVGSTEAGLKVEQDFLKSAGVPEGEVLLEDGSGLTRDNLVTPRAMITLLRYISAQPWGAAYISTLPIAGKDGTLENRLKHTPAAERIQAKTGSLERVRSMSGFATTVSGKHLIFAMFENNTSQSGIDAVAVFDAISVAMVEEIGAAPKLIHAH